MPARTYDPTIETRESYRARVTTFIEERETAASSAFSKRPRKDPRAFVLIADHLVGRQSYAEIWKATATNNRNTIRNACVELLDLLNDEKPAQK